MDITDSSSILNTPNISRTSNTSVLTKHKSVVFNTTNISSSTLKANEPASQKPFCVDDIPIVVPSFMQKYLEDKDENSQDTGLFSCFFYYCLIKLLELSACTCKQIFF